MKLKLDRDLCQGHGVCVTEAPEVFRLAEPSGELEVLEEEPAESLRAEVELAVRYCPTRALSLEG